MEILSWTYYKKGGNRGNMEELKRERERKKVEIGECFYQGLHLPKKAVECDSACPKKRKGEQELETRERVKEKEISFFNREFC